MASAWLAPQLPNSHNLIREINLTLLLDDRILIWECEADAAIRLHKPEQSDLINAISENFRFRFLPANPIWRISVHRKI